MYNKLLLIFSNSQEWILSAIFGYFLWFIVPIKHFIILTLFLIVANFILGLINPFKNEDRNSRKLVINFIVYFIGMLTAEGMRITFYEEIPFTYLLSGAICYYEFKFIIKSLEEITGVSIPNNILPKAIQKYAIKKDPLRKLPPREGEETTDLSSSHGVPPK